MSPLPYDILIHKFLTGVIDAQERQELEDWLERDEAHRRAFNEIKLLWESSADEEQGNEVADEQLEGDLRTLEESIEELRKMRTAGVRGRGRGATAVIISALLLLAACLIFLADRKQDADQQFRLASNANNELLLSDSSKVLLNKHSTLSVAFTDRERSATLSGEAFFNVAKRPTPFNIHANRVVLRVRGTSFVVRSYPREPVELYVLSGAVLIEHHSGKVLVLAGERATVQPQGGIHKEPNGDPNFDSWYTRRFTFSKTSLSEVLDLITKHYGVSFDVTQSDLLSCRFTGTFDNARLSEVIRILSYSLDIDFHIRGVNDYVVEGKGCG